MSVLKNNTEALTQYLQSIVKLEELQKMTEDLDKELEDSQRLMLEIKTMYNSIPNAQVNVPQFIPEMRRDELAQFLIADAPKLLLPDMSETDDVDVGNVLALMKTYTENLKKTISLADPQEDRPNRVVVNLDLKQYAASLDQFSKRLSSIKINNSNNGSKNAELEAKLKLLCDEINGFTQMVEVKAKLGEATKNWTLNQPDIATILLYDNMINKLLQNINEATCLLKNNN